jgi:hypothetical protein
VDAYTPEERRILDKIAVMEACRDNTEVMQAYERWPRAYSPREFYFVHTGREELDIRGRRWLGIRRNDVEFALMRCMPRARNQAAFRRKQKHQHEDERGDQHHGCAGGHAQVEAQIQPHHA